MTGQSSQDTPGVVSYTPSDAAARLAAAFGPEHVKYRQRPAPPRIYQGHPQGVLDTTLGPALDGMADVSEAPDADDQPAQISASEWQDVKGMAHTHLPDDTGM